MASKKVKHKTHPSESNTSEEDLGEILFHNREIIKELIDGCTLVEVVDKIIDVDPEQRTWDSLGSFLEMGHQLITNIKVMNRLRSKVIKTQEKHQAEISHLFEERAEVDHRFKEKSTKVEGLQEKVQNME
ncbi:putative ensconsin-like [Cocos nucifera]|uniref:Putative ensconsin-like n=1 Tax=Cocos nucifera TaxID=13894 RepID=A0A8K0IHG8_COCNU|nr:putative ensconsin-like [Cocos nucifera]